MGLWEWPWDRRRRGPSGLGPTSTAEEVTAGVDATHLTAIVTGATNGIGRETARVLARRGAEVIIPARTMESGNAVKQSIAEEVPGSRLHVMEMDLASLDSVRCFATAFDSSHTHLNILINNAGIMGCPFKLSKDGIELQFATNHVGHFLLTNLLLDKMKSTARKTGVQGRIVNVSSIAHKRSDGSCFDLNKLNDKSRYKPLIAYAHSKLANILHANELAKRFQEEGCNLTANSLHPGVILTNITRYVVTNSVMVSILSVGNLFLKNTQQGAATTCYLALHPELKDVSGKYFADCKEATPRPAARDAELAKRLWDFSEQLVDTNRRGEFNRQK
ncbi:short-chain dehydrogenase TIC 32, chloroplastic-like [Oryza glaberrima]|uniref:short-chain dehydrogenase TIC 32, chloroplastic-like n=1 Tax=Oryza glaberrima TaxID=4538 RepID=UPI00224C087C|nr:short-chain dehydrogenase TIC 32, chloroplastic-like [Oryza glaberrima]